MARAGGQDRGLFERPAGSGIWWIQYHHNGRKFREKVGRKSEARTRYRQRKEEIRLLKFDPDAVSRRHEEAPITVAELLAHYLPEMLVRNKRQREVKRLFEEFTEEWGSTPARDLTVGQVQAWKAHRLQNNRLRPPGTPRTAKWKDVADTAPQRPTAPATVDRYLAILQAVLELAVRDKLLTENVAKLAGKFRVDNERQQRLRRGQKQALRMALGSRYWPWVELAIETGMRQAEQFGLRREWVDLEARFIYLPGARSKSARVRKVALSQRAVQILRRILASHDSEWVFPAPRGRRRPDGTHESIPLDPRNFYNRVYKPALAKAGIQGLNWHDLRHTFGSEMAEAGVGGRILQDLLGHSDPRMTQRYSHLEPDVLLSAVDRRTDTETDTGPSE